MNCRLCKTRPAMPSRVRNYDYRCARCIHRSPAGQARVARYNLGQKRRAVVQRANKRRLWVGGDYHSAARSADEARRINDYIKEQRRGFIARLADRKEAQGAETR